MSEVTTRAERVLVSRSEVQPGLKYGQYRQVLRADFFHSCAYCTLTEAEGGGIRFAIDHYEPQNSRPDLVDEYSNLMWSCDTCNLYKSDRTPPEKARAQGVRFFRPDEDQYLDHFRRVKTRLEDITRTGWFTIEALDLNRETLQRIRGLRERLSSCEEAITAGVVALRRFSIDQLPNHLRGPAQRGIKSLIGAYEGVVDQIEVLLREHAKSHLLDEDETVEVRTEERLEKLKAVEALYPGLDWRAPRNRKGK